ncbi:MAG TPA: hypothetical protein VEX18_08805 [Polyangiaceae bacterium]|nr:hypothetical protein [Polyangiaceae bacterium]
MTVTRASVAEEEYFRRQEAERRSDEAWDSLQQRTKANRAQHERREAVSEPERPTQAAPGLVARLFARLRGSAAPKAKSSL